jgi:UDPglucose 6-dehydrogenase
MKPKNKSDILPKEVFRNKPSIIERISVVGLGKLGLCIAACLAYKGYHVLGIDIDPRKVDLINKGVPVIYEPGLAEMLSICRDNLIATQNYNYAIKNSDVTFVVVNTPSNPDGSYSSEQLISASKEIGRTIKDKDSFHVVAVTSTVLPGTTDNIVKPILEKNSEKKCGVDFGLCYNPEFIALGSVIRDFLNPDFVLIGESDTKSGEILSTIYKKICENDPKIVRMSIVNAELTKIALNSYVTMKISFANTLAEICERLPGGDVDVVTSALGLDKRIGSKYIKGGLGFGGPCFPRDNKAFSFFAKQVGCRARLAEACDQVNEDQVERIVQIVKNRLNGNGKIAILGLTYKTNTNIVEASQAIDIAKALQRYGHSISVYDPLGMDNAKGFLRDKVKYANSVKECIANADVCIIATPWDEFKKLNPDDFSIKSGKPVIIDCWRILDRSRFSEKTDYVGIGLGYKFSKREKNR